MNQTDKDLIEQIRNHFNISPTASLTDPYPIRLVEILQYTKSMSPKELTDEEIEKMAKRKANALLMDLLMPDVGNERRIDWNVGCTREHLKNFARAILKKAQEK